MLNMRKLTLDLLIAAIGVMAFLLLTALDDAPEQQEIVAQEIDQAIADEIKGQREQRAEFNRLAAEGERMTGMKAEVK